MAEMDEFDLNVKQRRFVEAYVQDGNATEAALTAGYSPKSAHAQGSRLLKNAKVVAAVAYLQELATEVAIVDTAMVFNEIAQIGLSNIRNYSKPIDPNLPLTADNLILDFTDTTYEQFAAISELSQEMYTEAVPNPNAAEGEDPIMQRVVRKVKVKLHPKMAALEQLVKLMGMIPQNPHIETQGGPVYVYAPNTADKETSEAEWSSMRSRPEIPS